MIWWQWDEEGKRWRPTRVPSDALLPVGDAAQLIPVAGARRCALLTADGAKVNGLPCLPIEVLVDRDEICIAGERYCFSQQSPLEVVIFTGENRRVRCARCLGRLVGGDEIVRCPGCRAHHHATCWTYDLKCQKCPFPTDDTLWTPDSLN